MTVEGDKLELWKVGLGIVAAFLLVVVLAFGLGRCTAPDPVELPAAVDVDGGPAREAYEQAMDAAVHVEDERLAAIEREHAEEVEAFTEADRLEFEATRARGRSALATWFKDRTRAALLVDGGR